MPGRARSHLRSSAPSAVHSLLGARVAARVRSKFNGSTVRGSTVQRFKVQRFKVQPFKGTLSSRLPCSKVVAGCNSVDSVVSCEGCKMPFMPLLKELGRASGVGVTINMALLTELGTSSSLKIRIRCRAERSGDGAFPWRGAPRLKCLSRQADEIRYGIGSAIPGAKARPTGLASSLAQGYR